MMEENCIPFQIELKTNKEIVCSECGKKFTTKFSLQRHEKNVHNRIIRCKYEIESSVTTNRNFCNQCGRSFSKDYTLRRHERNVHVNKELVVFICDVCEKICHTKTEFEDHWKTTHAIRVIILRKCPICELDVRSQDIFSHFEKEHHITTATEEKTFQNKKEFLCWKKKFEKETSSRFIVGYSTRKKSIRKYVCHRSGFFRSCSKGIRNLRIQGSKKINGFCPASIHVKKCSEGLLVKLIDTHVGHDKDSEIDYSVISPTKKQVIVKKPTIKVLKTSNIDNIQDPYDGMKLQKGHLVNFRNIDNVGVTSEHKIFKIEDIDVDIAIQTVTRKALDDCYFKIVEAINTEAGREFFLKYLEEGAEKIRIMEEKSQILVKNTIKM